MNLKDIPSRDICFYTLIIMAALASLCLIAAMTGLYTMFFVKLFCLTAGFFIFAVSICYALFGDDTKYHDILSTIFVAGGFMILCLSAYVCHIIELINQTS